MRKKALAIVASTAFMIAAVGATPATAATEAEIDACVDEATAILLEDPRYRFFRWVIRLGYWDATLRASCERTLP